MLVFFMSGLLIFYGTMMQAGLDRPFGVLVTMIFAATSAFILKFQLDTYVGGKVLEISSEARRATQAQPPNLAVVHAVAVAANTALALALCYAFEKKTFDDIWDPISGCGDWVHTCGDWTNTAVFVAAAIIPPAANAFAAAKFWKMLADGQ